MNEKSKEESVPLKRIEFAGGGTGGHLFPAMALSQVFKQRFPDCDILFWGTKRGIEFRLKHQLGYPLKTIRVRGFRRQFAISNLWIPFELLVSFFRLLMHFLIKRPDIVVGTGGYVSGPVLFAASCLKIPTVVHEQNSYPGATTRFLSKRAKRVYLTYPSSRRFFEDQEKIQVYGNPVRHLLKEYDRNQAIAQFGLNQDKKTVFVFGGSQGALGINRLMVEVAEQLLSEENVQILWAAGSAHYESIKDQIGEVEGLHLYPFIEKMYTAYSASDLVVSRSGATTIAELSCLGKPAVLIPFPYATGGHQESNARELEEEGAAVCMLERETSSGQFLWIIRMLVHDDERLMRMSQSMRKLARPSAAEDIVSDIVNSVLT